jgi:hypothetical protein
MGQWPAAAYERVARVKFLAGRQVPNPVALAGDIRTHWVPVVPEVIEPRLNVQEHAGNEADGQFQRSLQSCEGTTTGPA